jgi:Protein of unknown function VcgC/VcgE (DUF2780)
MKPNRWLIVLVSVAAFLGLGSTNWAAGWTDSLLGKDLDSLVGKQLGLTSDQSKGGIGAILGLAKEKLTSADFDKIAAAIPGADKYVAKAKKLGLLDKPVGNKEGLNSAFSKLGIPQDKASQMVPTVTDLMGKMGGDEVKKMLSSVLG